MNPVLRRPHRDVYQVVGKSASPESKCNYLLILLKKSKNGGVIARLKYFIFLCAISMKITPFLYDMSH